jgi:hypothetical protein
MNNDGVTNATDRSIVVSAWTGVGTNCAPNEVMDGESMGAQGGDAPLGSGESTGESVVGSDEVGPPAPTWTVVESPVVVEIRPAGGGEPTTNLLPGTTYELHYAGAIHPVEGYLFQASGCGPECLASAAPSSAGIWSDTGLFEYAALDDTALVLDDVPGGQLNVGTAGYLCTITTRSAGELVLDLRLYLNDPEAFVTHELVGTITATVDAE